MEHLSDLWDRIQAQRRDRQMRSLQKGDIELPNKGPIDPRLRTPEKPDVSKALSRAVEGVGILRKKGLLGGKR
jgi:hypothetical protein